MSNDDIKALLEHEVASISTLEHQARIGQVDKVLLKNSLENLRSILDYAAKDVREKLSQFSGNASLANDKVYFPYGLKKLDFTSSINKNLPNLNSFLPEVYLLIEGIQPFQSGENWLYDLCKLTNEAKHNSLSKTKNEKTVTILQPGAIHISGTDIEMFGNYFNGQRLDDVYVDEKGDFDIDKYSGSTEITINNKIKFDGKELEIVPFIYKCINNLKNFTTNLYSIL